METTTKNGLEVIPFPVQSRFGPIRLWSIKALERSYERAALWEWWCISGIHTKFPVRCRTHFCHNGIFTLVQYWKKCVEHSDDFVGEQWDMSMYH